MAKKTLDCQAVGKNLDAILKRKGQFDVTLEAGQLDEAKDIEVALEKMLEQFEVDFNMLRFPERHLFEQTIASIEAQAGSKVTELDRYDKYEVVDGQLNGRVKIKGVWRPVINGRVVEIEGLDPESNYGFHDVHNIGGKLNGVIKMTIEGRPIVKLVFEGQIADLFKTENYEDYRNVRFINGKLNGEVLTGISTWLPIKDGEVIKSTSSPMFGDETPIVTCGNIENINGKLNGWIGQGQPLRLTPVINDQVMLDFQRRTISRCGNIKNINGQLNGWVSFDNEVDLPVINGELIESMHGKKIEGCTDIENIDGRLNGRVMVDGKWLPGIIGELIDQISGRAIEDCENIRNIKGKMNGIVQVGGIGLPVINGELVEYFDGARVLGAKNIHNVGGTLNGELDLRRTTDAGADFIAEIKVVLGKIAIENDVL
ncbi:hypothetical protein EPO05_00165 [Patescibacteria group bacterium]|nr:MAG: hypothetical protein EPO05_00165 [Patescibacteria group bacterium]